MFYNEMQYAKDGYELVCSSEEGYILRTKVEI